MTDQPPTVSSKDQLQVPYRNVHELMSDLVACALIEGAQPGSLSANLATERAKQNLLDEIENRSSTLRKLRKQISDAYNLRDAAESRYCTALGQIEALTGHETPVATAALNTAMTAIGEAIDLLECAQPGDYLEGSSPEDWYSERDAWMGRNRLTDYSGCEEVPQKAVCNHDLQRADKTLKATLAPRWGWRCTVCGSEWYPEQVGERGQENKYTACVPLPEAPNP